MENKKLALKHKPSISRMEWESNNGGSLAIGTSNFQENSHMQKSMALIANFSPIDSHCLPWKPKRVNQQSIGFKILLLINK